MEGFSIIFTGKTEKGEKFTRSLMMKDIRKKGRFLKENAMEPEADCGYNFAISYRKQCKEDNES